MCPYKCDVCHHLKMSSCNDTCPISEFSTKVIILIPFTLAVGVPCIVLNAFILIIFFTKQTLRDNLYHCLVAMLSFSDLLVGLGYLSYAIQNLGYASSGFSKAMCIIKTAFVVSGTLMSLSQTFVIGLQRYLVLFHKNWNNALFKGSRKYTVCIVNWVVILIFSVGLISPQQEYSSDIICHVEYVYNKFYTIFMAFNRFIIILLVTTIIFYCITLRYIMKINKKVLPKQQDANQQTSTDQSTRHAQREEHQHQVIGKKLGNTMTLVGLLLGCLLVCTAPFFLSFIFPEVPKVFTVISACLCGLNSIINPILYSLKIRALRKIVKDIITCAKIHVQSR